MVSLISVASLQWTCECTAAQLIPDGEIKVMYLAGSLAGSQLMRITSSGAVLFCPRLSCRGVGFLSAPFKSLLCSARMSPPSRYQPSDTDVGFVILQLLYIKRWPWCSPFRHAFHLTQCRSSFWWRKQRDLGNGIRINKVVGVRKASQVLNPQGEDYAVMCYCI